MEVDHVPTLNDRPPSYTHPEPSSSTTAAWEAKSITQKSILALGFRRRAPWMTLRLFAPPGTRPPSTTSAPILLSTSRPVRGEIILSSTEPEEIAALHVDWRGWTPSLGQRSRHDVAYVRVDLPLPDAWDPATGRLPPGDYTIPWELPEGRLPTSYTHGDGSTHTLPPTFVLNGFAGFVQYQLDAVAERRATAPDGRLGSALSLLTSSNTPDARASLICGYLPVSRPAASEYSPGRAKLLREGIEEDDEPDGSDAWEVVHAGGCEVAIPKPLVFPRGEAVRIYYRCHDDAPPPTLAIDQLLTVGSDATVGTGGDDRPVSLIKPMVEATGEAADGPSTGWQRVELRWPSDAKPSFTFPNFSISYRLRVNSPAAGSTPAHAAIALTTSPPNFTDAGPHGLDHGIREVASPRDVGVGTAPEPSREAGKRLLGGTKRVVARVGPDDWQPVGSW